MRVTVHAFETDLNFEPRRYNLLHKQSSFNNTHKNVISLSWQSVSGQSFDKRCPELDPRFFFRPVAAGVFNGQTLVCLINFHGQNVAF